MSLQGPGGEEIPSGSADGAAQLRKFGPPALIALLALIFILQNRDSVDLDFLWMSFTFPLWLLLVIFAAVGAIVFWAVARRRAARKAKS